MDARTYKAITQAPDSFGRDSLEVTASLLETASLARRVQATLEREPVERPPLHRGDEADDFFVIDIPLSLACEIREELFDAEAAAVSPEGITTAAAAQAADLVDQWGRYIDLLADRDLERQLADLARHLCAWAEEHGGKIPAPQEVTKDGAVGQWLGDAWPTEAVWGEPLVPGRDPGQFAYAVVGDHFTLTVCRSDWTRFVLSDERPSGDSSGDVSDV